MRVMFRHVAITALLSLAYSSQVSPVEKVITLLQGMKTDIEAEGVSEAKTYDKFACFCKDTTVSKAKSVTAGQDNIDKLSASIAANTAKKNADESTLQALKVKKNGLGVDLESNVVRCAKEKAEYEGIAADFNKALSSLKTAIKAIEAKQGALAAVKAASLLEVDNGLKEILDLADAMGFIKAPKQKAFLQDAAADPAVSGYAYKSQDILDLLASLKKDFTKSKSELDTEFGKSSASCTALKSSISGKIETNSGESKSTSERIQKLGGEIADHRGKLVEAQDLMKDDEVYLKDLTHRCESKAGDWDQRSSMRAGEIEAISTALKVLGDKVQSADKAVNARVLLLTKKVPVVVPKKVAVSTPVTAVAKPKAETTKVAKVAPSFLQRMTINEHTSQEAREQAAKEQAAVAIEKEGARLKSPVLSALAMQVAADPFLKVKQLIQGLMERLIKEAAAESTKKGFCDQNLGVANHDRDFRWTRVKKLTANIQVFTSKQDELTESVATLSKTVELLEKAMVESTKLRAEEKKENQKTLGTGKEGLKAVSEALLVLKAFYKEAAGASLLQASPVDADAPDAGFSGAYKGQQGSSNAVLGLLQTIASDFDRTIRATERAEQESAESFVTFTRVTKVDIAGKNTQKELDAQDLKTTTQALAEARADFKTNMDLVDDAVKTLMELKPTCVDTGMSYSDRVAKREEEVKALQKAVCLLDTDKVEASCK